MSWTWFKTKAPPPIPDNGIYQYPRTQPYGFFRAGLDVFGPYLRPIVDATGGGTLDLRALRVFNPNTVIAQTYTPVSIAGNGAELTGNYGTLGLVDVTTAQQNGQAII